MTTTAIIPMGHPIPRRVLSQSEAWVIVDISTTERPLPKAYRKEDVIMETQEKTVEELTIINMPEPSAPVKDSQGQLIFSHMRVNTPHGAGITTMLNGDLWKVKLSTGRTMQFSPEELTVFQESDLEKRLKELEAQLSNMKESVELADAQRKAAELKFERLKESSETLAKEVKAREIQSNVNTTNGFGELAALKNEVTKLKQQNADLITKLNQAPSQQVDIKTVSNAIDDMTKGDAQLAQHFNEGWKIIDITYTSGIRFVLLSRPKQQLSVVQPAAQTVTDIVTGSVSGTVTSKIIGTYTDLLREGVTAEDLITASNLNALKTAMNQAGVKQS